MKYNNIYDYIEESIRKFPNSYALEDENDRITYLELEKRVCILCENLNSLVNYGDTIIIYSSRNISYIILMIALVKMGVVYLPMEKTTPLNVVSSIAQRCGAKYIISDDKIKNIYESLLLSDIENEHKDKTRIKSLYKRAHITPDDLIYIICTSGSSGMPKGVKIEHKNLINLITSLKKCVYEKTVLNLQSRIAVIASFSFDASIKQIYMALCYGATLIICPDRIKKMGRFAVEFFKEKKIDIVDATPSLITALSIDNKTDGYNELKLLLIGGEILREKHLQQARKIFKGDFYIVNLYGPTECCVDVAYNIISPLFSVKNPEAIMPIGQPLENINFHIDTANGNELVIEGASVGRGYTGSCEDSFELFSGEKRRYKTGDICQIGNDGLYYILGRLDNQVKVNGFRVELDTIDNEIMSLSKTTSSFSLCIYLHNRSYICSCVNTDHTVEQVKKFLSERLPYYMIPSFIIKSENEPHLNEHGKIDKSYYEREITKKLLNE